MSQINSKDFQIIKIQMMALKVMTIANAKTTKGAQALFWKLSPQGIKLMKEILVIRSANTENKGSDD